MFAVGDGCEVAGAADDGFGDSHFVGIVQRVWQNSKLKHVSDTLEIAYPDFITNVGRKQAVSKDVHPARSLRVRPPLPAALIPATLEEYQVGSGASQPAATFSRSVLNRRRRRRCCCRQLSPLPPHCPPPEQIGEAVDVLENAVWWHAVVCDRSATQGLELYLTGSKEQMWVAEPARLRLGRVYVAGMWRDRPLPRLPKGIVQLPAPSPQKARPQQQQQAAVKGGGAAPTSAAAGKPGGSNELTTTVLVRRSAREKESTLTMVRPERHNTAASPTCLPCV